MAATPARPETSPESSAETPSKTRSEAPSAALPATASQPSAQAPRAHGAGPRSEPPPVGAGRTRRLYEWTLREAETASGAAGIIALAFTGSALVPLFLEPPLVVLTTGVPRLWRRFALLFALGSIVGGVFTYVVGYAGMEVVGRAVLRAWAVEGQWDRLLHIAQGRWGFALVAAIALGPGPYKLVTMAAGAAGMPFPAFLAILVVGRTARFLFVSWLGRVFGERFTAWLHTRRGAAVYVWALGAAIAAAVVYAAYRFLAQ